MAGRRAQLWRVGVSLGVVAIIAAVLVLVVHGTGSAPPSTSAAKATHARGSASVATAPVATAPGSSPSGTSPGAPPSTQPTAPPSTQPSTPVTTAPHPRVDARVSDRMHLVLRDDFNGSSLDRDLWQTCYDWGCNIPTNHEYEWYSPTAVSVHGGALHLAERAVATHGEQFTSGMIQSNHRFDFRYGLIEVRARIPATTGAWPAIWLAPADLSWPPEIDIMERLDPMAPAITQSLHFHSYDTVLTRTLPGTISPGYHVFALDWQPDSITWYLDGHRTFSVHEAVDTLMYPIVNLAASLPRGEVDAARYPARFDIDWIRVYQRPGTGTVDCATTCVRR